VPAPATSSPPIDALPDTGVDLERSPAQAGMLAVSAPVVKLAFRRADQTALRHQGTHRQLSR
jgi:hypothetical protein